MVVVKALSSLFKLGRNTFWDFESSLVEVIQ